MRCELLQEKIKDAVKILDEIDELLKSQPDELSKIDSELSDYYHLIEANDLNEEQSHKVVHRIHELRQARRDLNNENELEKVYSTHKNKLIGTDTRQFLIAEINKKTKSLDTKYNNRILSDKEVDEILTTSEKKKRGRPKKESGERLDVLG